MHRKSAVDDSFDCLYADVIVENDQIIFVNIFV